MSLPIFASSAHGPGLKDIGQKLYALRLQEAENAISSLVLIALVTYFYTAFGKIFRTGGIGRDDIGSDHGGQKSNDETRRELGSPIYYSSPAAA